MIDRSNPSRITARAGGASAMFYPESRRVIVISENGRFDQADAALNELHREICPTDFEQCR